MQQCIHSMLLQIFRQTADHTKVKDTDLSVGHNAHVAGMRISVEKTIFEQLFEIEICAHTSDVVGVNIHIAERLQIRYAGTFNILNSQDAATREAPDDPGNLDSVEVAEVMPEGICVAT